MDLEDEDKSSEDSSDNKGVYQALPNPTKKARQVKTSMALSPRINDIKKLHNPLFYIFVILLLCFGAGYGGADFRHFALGGPLKKLFDFHWFRRKLRAKQETKQQLKSSP